MLVQEKSPKTSRARWENSFATLGEAKENSDRHSRTHAGHVAVVYRGKRF